MPGLRYVCRSCYPLSLLIRLLLGWFAMNCSYRSLSFQAVMKFGQRSCLIPLHFPDHLSIGARWLCAEQTDQSVSNGFEVFLLETVFGCFKKKKNGKYATGLGSGQRFVLNQHLRELGERIGWYIVQIDHIRWQKASDPAALSPGAFLIFNWPAVAAALSNARLLSAHSLFP